MSLYVSVICSFLFLNSISFGGLLGSLLLHMGCGGVGAVLHCRARALSTWASVVPAHRLSSCVSWT